MFNKSGIPLFASRSKSTISTSLSFFNTINNYCLIAFILAGSLTILYSLSNGGEGLSFVLGLALILIGLVLFLYVRLFLNMLKNIEDSKAELKVQTTAMQEQTQVLIQILNKK